jgi:centrosomal protein CEP44
MAAASGATGDIKNNLMKLLREIQRMKLRVEPDVQGLGLGAPSALLPIVHHSLMHYSLPLASWLARHDYDLYCKNDLRFVEGVYKVLREVFGCHPRLTKEQFLTVGYAERKLQLATDLLRACQSKHRSLCGPSLQRGGKGTRGRDRKRNSESSRTQPNSRSEVLTVQTTSGISSAWTEPLVARVQGGQEGGEFMSSLPHYSPPPHRLTPSQMLELTSSPLHTPTQHSPISPQSQPIIIRHETPPTNTDRKLFFSAESLKPEGLPSGHPPLDKLVIDCLSTSSEGGEEREEEEGGGHTRDGDEMEKGNKSEGGEPPQQQDLQQGVLSEVTQRVEQLAGMMERMSARFVILETQIKTIQTPSGPPWKTRNLGREETTGPPGNLGREGTSGPPLKPREGTSEPPSKNTVEPGNLGSEGDEERRKLNENRQHSSRREETLKEDVPLVSGVAKGTAVSMVTETPSSKARAALADLSNPRPLSERETLKSRRHTSTPLTRHTLTPVARRPRGRSGALSSQLARIRAEGQLSPLPSHPHTPSPSPSTVYSPSPSLSSPTATSPDETTRMIASLRDRAQRTKEFLQNANHRL